MILSTLLSGSDRETMRKASVEVAHAILNIYAHLFHRKGFDCLRGEAIITKTSFGTGRAVGHNRAVWQELNNISLALFVVLNCLVIRCVILCRGCYIPNKWYQSRAVVELTLRVTINNGRRREVKYRQSQEVLVDIPERITEHGLSSEITQSSGGSSDTSEGSENSGSFEESGRSDEGLML
ncbi:hypothetical protein Tco_0506554 [Tanacetum coccineum]